MSQSGVYVTNSGGTGFIQTLTGDTGGPVSPQAGNINIAGGHDINTVGNNATATITVNVDNAITLGDITPIAAGSPAMTAVTGDVDIDAGNINLPSTAAAGVAGVIKVNGDRFIHSYGTMNTFVGDIAGNFTLTTAVATGNTGVGADGVLFNLSTGTDNTAIGNGSLANITSGSDNVSLGAGSGTPINSGSNNIFLGAGAGNALVSVATSNTILIGNDGGTAGSSEIHIGGAQTKCFIFGIAGNTVGNAVPVVIDTVTEQLGVGPGTNIAFNYTNVNATPYVVAATDYYLSVDSSVLAITVQLPNAPTANRLFVIKDRLGNANVNNITVTTVGGVVLIDGAATFVMNANFQAIQLIFNGTSYEIY